MFHMYAGSTKNISLLCNFFCSISHCSGCLEDPGSQLVWEVDSLSEPQGGLL